MANVKHWWESLPSTKKAKTVMAGLVVGGVLAAYGVYVVSGERATRESKVPEAPTQRVALGDQLLRDDIKAGIVRDKEEENKRDIAQDEKIAALMQIQEALQKGQVVPTPRQSSRSAVNTVPDRPQFGADNAAPLTQDDVVVPAANRLAQPRQATPISYPVQQGNGSASAPAIEEARFIGGIGHDGGDAKVVDESSKKKNRTVFLPPSLMEAVLLTGMDAFTAEGAKEHPQPMMLRVQAPAVLPNSVKADLKGCFIIANGWGYLGAERVMTELVSLHCIAKNGDAVIDQEISGILTDTDGKQGLKGIVVTKAGAHVGRIFVAGVFGGIGNSISVSNTSTSVSPLGVTQTVDPTKVLESGIGQGIKDASADVRKIFLDLVKQTAPVIEIGATKKVGVVLTKGVTLEIREYGSHG